MINLLTQFSDLRKFDLSSLEVLAYGGSPMAPELIRHIRELLPHLRLVQVYGLSETGFLTGLKDQEHADDRMLSCGRPCPGVDVQVVDESGKRVENGHHGELWLAAQMLCGAIGTIPKKPRLHFVTVCFAREMLVIRMPTVTVTSWTLERHDRYGWRERLFRRSRGGHLPASRRSRNRCVWSTRSAVGEIVMACVVLKPGRALSPAELIAHCKRGLANYKVPGESNSLKLSYPRAAPAKY